MRQEERSEAPTEIAPYPTPETAPSIGDIVPLVSPYLSGNNFLRLPLLVADSGQLGDYWLTAASLAGKSHLADGTSGQDSFSFARTTDNQAVVAAVCDGLGRYKNTAQLGALILSRVLCSHLALIPREAYLADGQHCFTQAVRSANSDLVSILRQFGYQTFDQFSTTAAFCWISPATRGSRVLIGRIGDCFAFKQSTDYTHGFYNYYSRDADGAINEVSSSLPNPGPIQVEFRAERVGDGEKIVLVTDGLAEDIFSSKDTREWLVNRWSQERVSGLELLHCLSYRKQGSFDDRTALLIERSFRQQE